MLDQSVEALYISVSARTVNIYFTLNYEKERKKKLKKILILVQIYKVTAPWHDMDISQTEQDFILAVFLVVLYKRIYH